jgi:hypothetical protein
VPELLNKIYDYRASSEEETERYQHDLVVSYSSVEHDGLGRYGWGEDGERMGRGWGEDGERQAIG